MLISLVSESIHILMTSNKNVEDWTVHLLFIVGGEKQRDFSVYLLCFSWVNLRQEHHKCLAGHRFSMQNVMDILLLHSYMRVLLNVSHSEFEDFCFVRPPALGQVIKQPAIRMYMLIGQTLL